MSSVGLSSSGAGRSPLPAPSQQPLINNNDSNGAAVSIITPAESLPAAVTDDTFNTKWQSMTRTLAHYDIYEQIGEGTYGQVYRGRCKDTGDVVALKKMRLHHGGYWGMPLQLVREIKILKRLKHPNLLQLTEVVTSKGVEHLDPDDPPLPKHENKQKLSSSKSTVSATNTEHEAFKGNLFLILEYVSHDLTGLLDIGYNFQPVHIKCIFRQLLEALAYMHAQKYIHRDIKSSNILLDTHFNVKLADFGLARSMEPPLLDFQDGPNDMTNKVITLWYRPPEILAGATVYGPAVDVWSAGCILAELFLGKPLFPGKTELDQWNLIVDMLGTPSPETFEYLATANNRYTLPSNPKSSRLRDKYSKKMPGPALSLLEKLLEWDPRKRLTASNAMEHRYFWTQPVAPTNPRDLGPVLPAGVHFHEFQTKQCRKQAKAAAEQAKEQILSAGATSEEAQAEFDQVYWGLLKQVAVEGLPQKQPRTAALSAMEAAQKKPPPSVLQEPTQTKRSEDRPESRNREGGKERDESFRRLEDRRQPSRTPPRRFGTKTTTAPRQPRDESSPRLSEDRKQQDSKSRSRRREEDRPDHPERSEGNGSSRPRDAPDEEEQQRHKRRRRSEEGRHREEHRSSSKGEAGGSHRGRDGGSRGEPSVRDAGGEGDAAKQRKQERLKEKRRRSKEKRRSRSDRKGNRSDRERGRDDREGNPQDRNREDGKFTDRNREDRMREESIRADRNREDKNRDDRNREDRNREDRNREDRNREDRNREDRNREDDRGSDRRRDYGGRDHIRDREYERSRDYSRDRDYERDQRQRGWHRDVPRGGDREVGPGDPPRSYYGPAPADERRRFASGPPHRDGPPPPDGDRGFYGRQPPESIRRSDGGSGARGGGPRYTDRPRDNHGGRDRR